MGERRSIGGRRGPRGLAVDLLRVDGEVFAVFAWDAPSADAVAAASELTAAERDVLGRVVGGASNAAIARARRTSTRTVANQIAGLLRKLGADSRFDLIRRFGGTGGRAKT